MAPGWFIRECKRSAANTHGGVGRERWGYEPGKCAVRADCAGAVERVAFCVYVYDTRLRVLAVEYVYVAPQFWRSKVMKRFCHTS